MIYEESESATHTHISSIVSSLISCSARAVTSSLRTP